MYMTDENLKSCLNKYWTPQKCGKVEDLADTHESLLAKYMKVSPNDLFEQLAENKFKFKPMKASWSEFLKNANLAEYLDPKYTEEALNVTGGQPAIGKGEFLFASCYSNIGFCNGRGDLRNMDNGQITEFKGIRSNLSGYGNQYKQMNSSLLLSIFGLFNTNVEGNNFNRDIAKKLDELLKKQPDKLLEVLKRLQNLNNPDVDVASKYEKLYQIKPNIFDIAGAQQLEIYMTQQKASFMVFSNDIGFCCCAFPKTPQDAYNVVTYNGVKLSSWFEGETGFTIGI